MSKTSQSPNQIAPICSAHLRLVWETNRQSADLRHIRFVREPLVPESRVIGPLVSQVVCGDDLSWTETLLDPLLERAIPRPQQREHFFAEKEKGSFTVRVPLREDHSIHSCKVRLFWATGQIPEKIADLEKMLPAETSDDFRLLHSVPLLALEKHPDWKRLLESGAILIQGSEETPQ